MSAPAFVELSPKAIAALKARAALVEVALQVTTSDAGARLFIDLKWAMTTQLHSLDELQVFLRHMGPLAA